MFTQNVWVISNVLKCPSVCLEIRAFSTHLLGGQLCRIPYTFLARQSHFRHRSQKSFEQRKEVTFDSRLENVRALVIRGSHCPSSQNLIKKALHEITVNSQGWPNLFSRIFVSSVTPQPLIITSSDI